jgi:uncharacterized spore protein YtfJ
MDQKTDVATTAPSAKIDELPREFTGLAGGQALHSMGLPERIFAAARPGAVFGEPVATGGVTVITASEVSSGGGFGSGSGFGRGQPRPGQGEQASGASASNAPDVGGGGGMGGGGGAMGRPVAAIVIGPDGVQIKPIYDVTKVALAGLAALGTIMAIWSRSRRR